MKASLFLGFLEFTPLLYLLKLELQSLMIENVIGS